MGTKGREIVGKHAKRVIELLNKAFADELRHADMVSVRINQLGGTAGEQCAISVHHALLEEVNGKDPVTCNLATQILQNEVGHEEDRRRCRRIGTRCFGIEGRRRIAGAEPTEKG